MKALEIFLMVFIALEHVYFMILEMFYWNKPKGRKVFGLTREFAEESKVLAANQGLYNGFLAAGLIWAILDQTYSKPLSCFFLVCVVLAGTYGAYSTKKIKIFYLQAIPAIIALILVLFS